MGRLINSLFALSAALTASLVPATVYSQASPDETRAWQAAQRAGTAEAFQMFLELYPDGQYSTQAFAELADSFATAAGASAAENDQSEPADVSAGSTASSGGGTDGGMY